RSCATRPAPPASCVCPATLLVGPASAPPDSPLAVTPPSPLRRLGALAPWPECAEATAVRLRKGRGRMSFREALKEQRWDDHRYYHHSRINQSLHLLSAVSFLCTYVLLFVQPVAAALVGWLVAMISRQIGHFFFEPQGH